MDLAERECTICGRTTSLGYNYGVLTCSPCKMFFHRALFNRDMNAHCTHIQPRPRCRKCRFQKCVESGMVYMPTETPMTAKNYDKLCALLYNLKVMDFHREFKLKNFHLPGDPSVTELANSGRIPLQRRAIDVEMDQTEWAYMSGITVIDYVCNFPFINNLEPKDKKIVFVHCGFLMALLSDALRAVRAKQDYICFPDGMEVIELHRTEISTEFKKKIRCKLAGLANEMKLQEEEVFLLSTIIMSYQADEMSPSASQSLEYHQRFYRSALNQYLRVTYQHDAPIRLMQLLSFFNSLVEARTGIINHAIIRATRGCPVRSKRLFEN